MRGRATSIVIERARRWIGDGRVRDGVALRVVWVVAGRHGTERLAMGPVDDGLALLRVDASTTALGRQAARVAKVRISRVGGHEGLRLRRDGREDAFLLKALAIRAAAVFGRFEAGAAYLGRRSACPHRGRDGNDGMAVQGGHSLSASCNSDKRWRSADAGPAG